MRLMSVVHKATVSIALNVRKRERLCMTFGCVQGANRYRRSDEAHVLPEMQEVDAGTAKESGGLSDDNS